MPGITIVSTPLPAGHPPTAVLVFAEVMASGSVHVNPVTINGARTGPGCAGFGARIGPGYAGVGARTSPGCG
jgi:hypothetical protein